MKYTKFSFLKGTEAKEFLEFCWDNSIVAEQHGDKVKVYLPIDEACNQLDKFKKERMPGLKLLKGKFTNDNHKG